MFGCINIFKPSGLTSHDVVARVRRWYGFKKVGHLGTLDPAAQGVLPLCVGQATRLMEYFPDDKTYEALIEFGRLTTTLDNEGETLETTPAPQLTLADVEAVLPQFTGTISMTVPHHAAVHYKGKKLYHYAHQGVRLPEEELPKKETTIFDLDVLEFIQGEFPQLRLQVHCSSGTYVRALARDLGRALGLCGGTLTLLIRTGHGRFKRDTAIPLDELEAKTQQGQRPLENPALYLGMPLFSIAQPSRYQFLVNGGTIPLLAGDPPLQGNSLVLAVHQATLVGVLQKEGQRWKPVKILNAPMPGMAQPALVSG